MQEEWQKERQALLISIKEKEDRLKDFEKVRCQQHFHLLPEHVVCALRSDSTPILLRWFLVCTALTQDKMFFFCFVSCQTIKAAWSCHECEHFMGKIQSFISTAIMDAKLYILFFLNLSPDDRNNLNHSCKISEVVKKFERAQRYGVWFEMGNIDWYLIEKEFLCV